MDFFPYNTDAAIELVDSLSTNLQAKSPVELSLNPCHSRHYSSLPHVIGGYYKSRETRIEESRKALDKANEKIQHSLCQNIGMDSGPEYHLFAIDVTPNKTTLCKKTSGQGICACQRDGDRQKNRWPLVINIHVLPTSHRTNIGHCH